MVTALIEDIDGLTDVQIATAFTVELIAAPSWESFRACHVARLGGMASIREEIAFFAGALAIEAASQDVEWGTSHDLSETLEGLAELFLSSTPRVDDWSAGCFVRLALDRGRLQR